MRLNLLSMFTIVQSAVFKIQLMFWKHRFSMYFQMQRWFFVILVRFPRSRWSTRIKRYLMRKRSKRVTLRNWFQILILQSLSKNDIQIPLSLIISLELWSCIIDLNTLLVLEFIGWVFTNFTYFLERKSELWSKNEPIDWHFKIEFKYSRLYYNFTILQSFIEVMSKAGFNYSQLFM